MLTATRKCCSQLAAISAIFVLAPLAAASQATKPAPAVSPTVQLQPYTASDESASAGVPSGWKVKSGAQTVIKMTGPEGQTVSLGNTVVAKDAAFQLGEHSAGGIDLSMPYSATLPEKFTMILQQSAASSGKTVAQVIINSTTPLLLPAAIAECGRIVAEVTGQNGDTKVMAVFCSLPVDSGGTYKNIMLLAQAFATNAAQTAPVAQAIFQSYRIPTTWLQKKLAPFSAPPAAAASATAAEAAAVNRATMQGLAGADNTANCFDLSVLRQTPTYDLPRSCGGTKHD